MKIDWLEGTILDKDQHSGLRDLKDLFPDWQELGHGGLGYECSAVVLESGRIFWSETRVENGIHISLPPSAISLANRDFISYASILKGWGARFTRLDLAEDDTTGMLDLGVICKAVESGWFTSIAKKRPMQIIDYESDGRTFYFGRAQSLTRIRIYDKAAEQMVSGKLYVGHWVRVEMQLRDERANSAVGFILEHLENWQIESCGWLRSALDFKIPDADSNKSRWKSTEWWLLFLDYASKARIFVPRKIQTIETIAGWVGHQVAPSLLVLQTVYGKNSLSDMATSAAHRLKPKHVAIIKSARSAMPASRDKRDDLAS